MYVCVCVGVLIQYECEVFVCVHMLATICMRMY